MLLDVQVTVQVLHAYVVHVHIVASRDRADAIENVLRRRCARNRMDHNISIGEQPVNGAGDLVRDLAGPLESDIASQTDGDICKIAIAGAPDAHAIYFKKTF